MKKVNNQTKFIFISFAIHGLFFIFLLIIGIDAKTQKNNSTEIVLVDSNDLEKNNLHDISNPQQIVETDEKSANDIKNDKAKYLSAKNNVVEKETLAQRGDKTKNTESKNLKNLQQKPNLKNMPEMAQFKPEKGSKKTSLEKDLFGEKFNAYESLEKSELIKNAQSQKNQKRQVANLGQNQSEASTSNEKIDGIDTSLKTALNTREYKYYGYYQRIKNQLNQFWQPQVKQKMTKLFQSGRTIASENNDKTTRLVIFLNDQGTLVKIQVLSESGVRDLDDAAIEAFRQAAPFPNPPRGIVDNDGTIKIRWDFVVES